MTTDSSLDTKSNRTKSRLTIILLFLVFLAPGVGSWILYKHTDLGRDGGTASTGDLIIPPITLQDYELLDPHEPMKEAQLHKKWSLLYFTRENCDEQCLQKVYAMRQIRLAIGKHYERVQRVILIDKVTDSADLKKRLQEFNGQLVLKSQKVDQTFIDAFKVEGIEDPFAEGRIYIIDPLGNLMMSYALDADPKGIIRDLTKIFRVSRI